MAEILDSARVTMKTILKILFVLTVAMLLATPFVQATSIVNVANMNTGQVLLIVNSPNERWFTQSFTTLGDGLNLTTIVLPLTIESHHVNDSQPPGLLHAEIRAVTVFGLIDPAGFAIVAGTSDGYGVPISNDAADIYWVNIPVTPTQLLPCTQYALVVYEEWTPYNWTCFAWWADGYINMVGSTNYAYCFDPATSGFEPMPYWNVTATGNEFAFGFELIEGVSSFSGVTADAPLFLSLFLCLGLGVVGFGMTRGKEPLAAIFMMEFGVFITYMMGWLPAWILAASFAVLGIILAYKFRGVISR